MGRSDVRVRVFVSAGTLGVCGAGSPIFRDFAGRLAEQEAEVLAGAKLPPTPPKVLMAASGASLGTGASSGKAPITPRGMMTAGLDETLSLELREAMSARDKAMAQIRSLLDTLKALGEVRQPGGALLTGQRRKIPGVTRVFNSFCMLA